MPLDTSGVLSEPGSPGGDPAALPFDTAGVMVNPGALTPDQQDPTQGGIIDFSPGEQVAAPRTTKGELGRGIGAGLRQVEAAGYGIASLFGQLVDSDGIHEFGKTGAQDALTLAAQHGPRVGSLGDINNAKDFFHYAAGAIGEGLPSIALSFAGGGLGATIARRAFALQLRNEVVKDAIETMGKEYAGQLTNTEIKGAMRKWLAYPPVQRMLINRTLLGSSLGVADTSFLQETGGVVNDLDQRGLSAPGTAIVAGGLNAALEAAPVARLIGKMFHGVEPGLARSFIKDMAHTVGTQALFEGSTEAAQELVAMSALAFHDPSYNPLDHQGLLRIADAGAMGALMGAAAGGAEVPAERIIHSPKNAFNAIKEGGAQLRTFIAGQTKAGVGLNEGDAKAEQAVPGWGAVVDTVTTGVRDAYTKVATGLRSRAAEGLQSVMDDVGAAPNSSLNDKINQAESALRERIRPEMDRLNTRVRSALDTIREHAKTLAASDRVAYIRDAAEKLSKQVSDYVNERFHGVVKDVEDKTNEDIATNDLPDEHSFGFEDDTTEEGAASATGDEIIQAVEPRQRIGDNVKRQFRTGADTVSRPVSTRSRGDDAVPFADRASAERAAEEVRAQYKMPDDAVQVDESEPGKFFVHIYDEGAAEEFAQNEKAVDALTKSMALAHGKDIRTNPRVFEVRRPGTTKTTRLDLPTFAFGGMDMNDRAGMTKPDSRVQGALRGMDALIARLVDQGFEIVGGMEALAGKHILPNLTVADARSRMAYEQDPDEVPSFLEGATGKGTLEGINSELGDSANKSSEGLTEEERGRQTDEDQATDSARAKAAPTTGPKITTSPSNKNVRIGLLNHSQARRDRVAQLVSDFVKMAGMADKELFVVDRQGMEKLMASADFSTNWKWAFTQTIADDANSQIGGKIIRTAAKDRFVIYVSNRVIAQHGEQQMFRVLAHELGHMLQDIHFDTLPRYLREKMMDDHHDSKSPLEFNEWMADQFVAWAVRDEKPKGAIQRFFSTLKDKLFKLFNAFQQKFHLSDTYNEFMKGVSAVQTMDGDMNEWGKAILQQRFADQGKAAGLGKMIPPGPEAINTSDLTMDEARKMAKADFRALKERLTKSYPRLMQHAGQVWNTMDKINLHWFTSLNGAIRSHKLKAFDQLADFFNKTPGDEYKGPLYFDNVQRNRARFSTMANRAFDGVSPAEIDAAQKELIGLNGRGGEHQTGLAKELRTMLEQMHAYMINAGLPVNRIENYWPKVYDHQKVIDGNPQLIADLAAVGITDQQVQERIIANMVTHDGEVDFTGVVPPSQALGVPTDMYLQARNKVLQDPRFDKYVVDDPKAALTRYINSTVKRAEFNRGLGQDARTLGPKDTWNPRAKYEEIVKQAMAEGATQEQLDFLSKAVDANLGRYGSNTPDKARRIMSWIATYENMRVLGFSQLSSLPDLIGPAIRSRDYQQAFKVLREQMKEITSKDSNINEAGRVWGIISDTFNQHVLTEEYDTHWYAEGARKLNDGFFKYTGMEKLNNFIRSYALAVGQDFIVRQAKAGNSKDLAELGLTVEDVQKWVDGGKKIFGSMSEVGSQDPADEKIAAALVRFVNEANMRPNPSMRPLMASHPALMLVWHLKSYMFAFYDTVMRQIWQNAKSAGVPWQKVVAVALPAALMMAMTAVGWELRELIQYQIWGAEGRTSRMTGAEYTWELMQRAGLLGAGQLVADYDTMEKRGNLGLVGVAGPTLQQLADAATQNFSTTAAKALPIINQIPPLREAAAGR